MNIDIEKNKAYYESDDSIPCDCQYCFNYVINIEKEYPNISEFLKSMNVDILKPFDLIYKEDSKNKNVQYISCQYIVFGECRDDFETEVTGIKVTKSKSHTDTNVDGPHFILEFGPISLKYDVYQKNSSKITNYYNFLGKLINVKTYPFSKISILTLSNKEETIKVSLGKEAALRLDVGKMYDVGIVGKKVVSMKPYGS